MLPGLGLPAARSCLCSRGCGTGSRGCCTEAPGGWAQGLAHSESPQGTWRISLLSQCSCAGGQLAWSLLAFFGRISEQGLPRTCLPPGLVLAQKLLFQAARAKAEPGVLCTLSPFTSTVLILAWEEEEGSLMYWDQQLGTGTVPGWAALASCVSLLQAMGTLSTGISRTLVPYPVWL